MSSRLLSRRLAPALAAFLALATVSAFAAKLPAAKPQEVGLSAERLDRLGAVMQQYVDAGKVPGLVVLVVRDGKAAYFKAFGKLDLGRGTPMPLNGIFRIASQSKAVTSVALMTLVEEGRISLGDPVSKFIPEFKESKVALQAADKGATGYSIVPAKREITIRDLLTHTAGISYGDGPAADLYKAAGVQGWSFVSKDMPIGDGIRKLARLPFDAQPGERWVYGFNIDILGYVVEVVSGMSLADYIEKKITGPLGMSDTRFFLPEANAGRFASVYGVGKDGKLELVEDALDSPYLKGPHRCYSGGAGLLSTAEDYARFLQMLGNGGELDGVRVLGPKTVEVMTVNQVGDLYGTRGQGFGLGFWVTSDVGKTGEMGSVGAFGWGGAYYTTYWVDPAERLVAVFMTQLLPAGGLDLQAKFRTLVYQSIIDSHERR
ncbi:MAG TPA: serine hydrolase domain-containing protein [Burkholderiales bacterium]|nr:serine hydrolase domain-containing protein [Burkholderiales bacterium]